MKKPEKKTAGVIALAVMLLFSVGFFAFLKPTTAWFTDSEATSEEYSMGYAALDEGEFATTNVNWVFPASVKLSDYIDSGATADDIKTFEYGCKYTVIEDVENDGDVPLRFSVDVFDHNASTKNYVQKGLRYFVFYYDSTDNKVSAVSPTEYVNDVYVDSSDDRVIKNGSDLFKLSFSGNTMHDEMVSVLGNFNNSLDAANNRVVSVDPGDTTSVCVVFWYEYDDAFGTPDYSGQGYTYENTTAPTGVRGQAANVDVIVQPIQSDNYPTGTTAQQTTAQETTTQ